MDVCHIVCVDANGGYANSSENKLQWHVPEDLSFFRHTTTGHPCIMGRNTYESIVPYVQRGDPTQLLPNRRCVVITTRTLDIEHYGDVHSALTALGSAAPEKVFVIGGRRLWQDTAPIVNTVYITKLPQIYGCDMAYPLYNRLRQDFQLVSTRQVGDIVFEEHRRN